MRDLAGVLLVIIFVFLALGLTLAGVGYAVQLCRRLIGRLLVRQHSP